MRETPDESRLIELASLPPGDARRAAAMKDPLVRAWLLEHDAFLDAPPLSPEDERAVARAADTALAKARAEASRAAGVVHELRPARERRAGLPRWALAAAGVALVAGAAVVVPRFMSQESSNLRSLSPGTMAEPFASLPAARDLGGRLVLAWHPEAGATAYRVEILSGLDAVASYDVTDADSLVLDPAALPAGEGLLWRVLALRDGAPVATTAPRTLPR